VASGRKGDLLLGCHAIKLARGQEIRIADDRR
jgi:hypothetical protein